MAIAFLVVVMLPMAMMQQMNADTLTTKTIEVSARPVACFSGIRPL